MKEARDIRERTFEFAIRVLKLCRQLEATPGASRTLVSQLVRSGTAVGASVDEAHSNHTRTDFIAVMSLAAREARETHYWLRLLAAADVIHLSELVDITDECQQLIAILTTIVKRSRENLG